MLERPQAADGAGLDARPRNRPEGLVDGAGLDAIAAKHRRLARGQI